MHAFAFFLLNAFAAIAICAPADVASTFQQQCLSFTPETFIKNSTRTHLEYVTNGTTLVFPDNVASCARPSQLVSTNLCRIALSIPTSNRSSITFELWLPETWPVARYLSTGNGGIDGCVKYEDLAYTTANGFASMGTNNGHNGTTGVTFLNNPDILQDYAYRALHVGTATGKLLTEKFYSKAPSYSYYLGCSLGGRMGIKAAEAFPDDFDGIVAGCPAVDFNHLQGERAMFYTITGAVNSTDFITADQWTGLIHDEVLKQCNEIDGVKDGIIEVPDKCHFRPETLLCNEYKSLECLNGEQVLQLKQIYATYLYPDGRLIFPRMNPGNEIMAATKFFAGSPFSYSEDWFRYVVLNDTTWNASLYNSSLAALADTQNPFNIRTFPGTLPTFKPRGGKIISYHGGQDNQITSFNTERFWNRMYRSDPNLQDYYRFFRISGMFHCSSGPGAWVIGQGGGASAVGVLFERHQNVLAAMVEWVENGVAPETLVGTKFVNDSVALGIDFQRNHCLYPLEQTYVGGDYKQVSSWK
ncbi:putative feruloyl esterase B-2, partial [Lachnellula suecica]